MLVMKYCSWQSVQKAQSYLLVILLILVNILFWFNSFIIIHFKGPEIRRSDFLRELKDLCRQDVFW